MQDSHSVFDDNGIWGADLIQITLHQIYVKIVE